MLNIGDVIGMHNKATLQLSNRKSKDKDKQCNCRDPSICLVEGRCKEGPIVHKATLTSQNKSMVYCRSCETEFKIRCNNHKQSFKFENKKTRHKTLESDLECLRSRGNPIDRVVHCKTCTTLSMWFKDMPALPIRKNVHLTSRQEKLAKQKIRTSV